MNAGLDTLLSEGRLTMTVRACLGARSGRVSRWALVLALAALCAVLAWLLVQVHQLQDRLQSLDRAESELAERRSMRKPRVSPAPSWTDRQARLADTVIDRLNVPWRQVLDDVERHTPPSVAILQLEPEVSSSSLSLLVEAKSPEDVFAYLEDMKGARSLTRLRVLKHETNVQDAAQPIRFLLKGQLVPNGSTVATHAGAGPQALAGVQR